MKRNMANAEQIKAILEMNDQMKEAMDSGTGYQTKLDPPPADERVAHKVGK